MLHNTIIFHDKWNISILLEFPFFESQVNNKNIYFFHLIFLLRWALKIITYHNYSKDMKTCRRYHRWDIQLIKIKFRQFFFIYLGQRTTSMFQFGFAVMKINSQFQHQIFSKAFWCSDSRNMSSLWRYRIWMIKGEFRTIRGSLFRIFMLNFFAT